MEAESAVEKVIYSFGGLLFSRLINPLIILFVVFAIALFLYVMFKKFIWEREFEDAGKDQYQNMFWPILGLTIMLSAIGITYFIGNTGNEIFQGTRGAGALKGVKEVVQPINIR